MYSRGKEEEVGVEAKQEKMLPPIDDDVLRNNPDFERVYKKVTGGLLNPDGSTRDDEATARKREAVRQVGN